ncbi:MAG: phosphotransferase [Solirubrobacteraceae bacterium]
MIETARAVPALDGSRLLSLVADDGHVFHAVMFEWLAGVTPAESDLSRSFVQLGEITARMHRHVGTWTPPAGFVRFAWDYEGTLGPHGHWGRWQDGLGVGREELEQLSRLDARIRRDLERYGSGPDRYGLVHADARLANLLVDGDQIRVIDFDDCGWSWFMYDFASAVSFMETNPVVPELAAAWLEGYKRVRPVARADEEMLPTFVALRRLLLLAWIGSHYETASEAADLGAAFVVETCEFAESHLSGRALLRGV